MFNEERGKKNIAALITWRGGSETFSPLISNKIKDLTICSENILKDCLITKAFAFVRVGGIEFFASYPQSQPTKKQFEVRKLLSSSPSRRHSTRGKYSPH